MISQSRLGVSPFNEWTNRISYSK